MDKPIDAISKDCKITRGDLPKYRKLSHSEAAAYIINIINQVLIKDPHQIQFEVCYRSIYLVCLHVNPLEKTRLSLDIIEHLRDNLTNYEKKRETMVMDVLEFFLRTIYGGTRAEFLQTIYQIDDIESAK